MGSEELFSGVQARTGGLKPGDKVILGPSQPWDSLSTPMSKERRWKVHEAEEA